MEQHPPPFEKPPSRFGHMSFPVNTNYHRNAMLGNILLFGSLGVIAVIIGNVIGWLFDHYIAIIFANMIVPILIGYQAGKTAMKSSIVNTLRNVTLFGAGSAALTATFVTVTLCSCMMSFALVAEGNLRSTDGGLLGYLEQKDISAAMIVLVVLGIMIGGIFLYASFGAVGAAVAGIRGGINQQAEFQFDDFGDG